MTNNNTPAIFIGIEESPAYGEWVKLDGGIDADSIEELAQEILNKYRLQYREFASEWCVADQEHIPFDADVDSALLWAELIAEHPEQAEEMAAYIDTRGAHYVLYDSDKLVDADEFYEGFEAAYLGTFDEVADYFYDLMEDSGAEKALREFNLHNYMYDLAKLQARDVEYSGDIDAIKLPNGQYALFENHA